MSAVCEATVRRPKVERSTLHDHSNLAQTTVTGSSEAHIGACELAELKNVGLTEAALRKVRIKRLTAAEKADLLGVLIRDQHPAGKLVTFSLTPMRPVRGNSYLQFAVCQFFDPKYPTMTGPTPTGDAWFDNKSLSSYPFGASVTVCFRASAKALVEFHLSVGVNDVRTADARFQVTSSAGGHDPTSQEIAVAAVLGGSTQVLTALCDAGRQTGELPFFAMVEQRNVASDPQIWWRFHSASVTRATSHTSS
jgi:hypothetical protein